MSDQGKRDDGDRPGELGPLPGGHHGLSPEQVADSQRERLLAAAAHCVAESGYRATTITEIVKTASVSNRVFYENFKDKEDCYLAAFDALATHFGAVLTDAAEPHDDWPDQAVAGLRTGLRYFDSEPELTKAFLLEPTTASPAIVARFREAVMAGAPFLARGRGERSENASLPESTEDSILGGLVVLASTSVIDGSEPLESILPDLIAFVLTPYLGRGEAQRRAALAAQGGEHEEPQCAL